jgi:hypothetical protein
MAVTLDLSTIEDQVELVPVSELLQGCFQWLILDLHIDKLFEPLL